MDEILNSISIINKSPILSSTFNKFLILEPYNNIKHFIQNNENKFKKNGWKLNHIEYKHPKRGSIAKNCLEISAM